MNYSTEAQQELFELSHSLLTRAKQGGAEFDKETASELVAQLHQTIRYHEWRYYVLNEPVLSDFEFDSLFSLLKRIEQKFSDLRTSDSPTVRVSSDLANTDGTTVRHLSPMLSLENSYNEADLQEFDKRIRKLLLLDDEVILSYCAEPKFDGGTIVVRYENDTLFVAATRGNGTEGEDITANAKVIATLPTKANFSKYGIAVAEVRGEVLLRKTVFERLNAQRLAKNETLLANPRNAATGAIRMKNPEEVAARGLEVFIYQLSYAADAQGQPIDTAQIFGAHNHIIDILAELGFKTPKDNTERKTCLGISAVVDFCRHWAEIRESYEYEIDGMVIKLNDLNMQTRLGYTSHHPRWAAAFKFQAKQATTKLENIEFQIGRLGTITPVAKLKTVELAGVQISSVSLHNADLIAQKDIRIGDIVLVERAADVIPQIVQPLADLRNGTEQIVIFPTHCPACKAELERIEGEAAWRCNNSLVCPAQQLQKYIHFASKDAMNIDGLGESQIERFYKLGWLNKLTDIYRLDYNKIATLEGLCKRSAANLQKAIDNSRQKPAARLLYALGIRHIGRTNSRNFVANTNKLQDLATWSEEDMMRLPDIGPKAAQQLRKAFVENNILALLDEFEALNVNTSTLDDERPKVADENAPFANKTILFTGTLPTLKRDDAEELARKAGAKIASSVSKSLGFLVVGEAAGSKLDKAQKLGITTLSEADFLALLDHK